MKEIKSRGWIGVDLDGTLAEYVGWKGGEIGRPVPAMLERVKAWLAEGQPVRIMTARVACCGKSNEVGTVDDEAFANDQRERIEQWCIEHGLGILPVTATKDFEMIALWDDRAVAVEVNTGRVLNERTIEIAFNLERLEALTHEERMTASLVSADWPTATTPMRLMPSMHIVRDAIRGGARVVKAGEE